MNSQIPRADARLARRLPSGAAVIVFFEFLERFAFYSTLSLLALYLVGPRAQQGFGWSETSALRLLGVYTGLMYATPAIGGWLADRWIGHRPAIVIGAILMIAGYALLAAPPFLIGLRSSADPSLAVRFAAVPGALGAWQAPSALSAELASVYVLISRAFWLALTVIVVGNALIKATLVVILGNAFTAGDSRRDTAYAYYYAAINIGGLLAGFCAGSVAAYWGWHAAFSVSGFAILCGLVIFFAATGRSRVVKSTATKISERPPASWAHLGPHASARVGLLVILAALLMLYAVGSFQIYGTMSLFLEVRVDRNFFGFQLPVPWFTSLNAAALTLSAPAFALLWRRLAVQGRELDIVGKYAIALLLGASGLLIFAFSAWQNTTGRSAHWETPAVGIMLQAIGEVVAWTSTYGMVYRLAPPGFQAATMGVFYALTLGLGGYAAGWVGTFSKGMGETTYFSVLGLASAAAAILALAFRPMLLKVAEKMNASLR